MNGEKDCYAEERKNAGQEFLSEWAELVQRGKNEKLIRDDLNEISVALILYMQLIGFLKIYPKLKKPLQLEFNVSEDQILKEYFDLIFHGMIKK
jgi:hypothetical protein